MASELYIPVDPERIDELAKRIVDAIAFDDSDPFGPEWSIREHAPTIGLQEQYAVASAWLAMRRTEASDA